MTTVLRSSMTAVLALFMLTVSAHAQAAFPGEPGGGMFPSLTLGDPSMIPAPNAVEGQWTIGTSMPKAKEWHAVTSLNGMIYTFGGYIVNGTSLVPDAASYVYDPALDLWSPIMDFPKASIVNSTAFTVNGKIYILGGVEFNSGVAGNYLGNTTVYEYDPVADTYTTKSPMPSVQYFSAYGVIGNSIYVISGRNATQYISTVQVYDTETDTWSTATNFPVAMMNPGFAWENGKIITAGGVSGAGIFRSVYMGELQSGTLAWKALPAYPLSYIQQASGVGLNGIAYFTGGTSVQTGEDATQFTYGLDLASETWSIFDKKPTGIKDSRLAVVDDKVYAVGGRITGNFATASCEIFDPNAQPSADASVSPTQLMITASTMDMTKRSKPIQITSIGRAEVNWTVEVDGDHPWISLGLTSGTVANYESVDVEVFVDPATMQPGENVGSILVTFDLPENPSYMIQVYGYPSAGEVSVPKKVLVEEFSGTWCGFCPQGVDSLKALEAQFGDQISIVTYHQGNHDPMVTSVGNQVMAYLGVNSYPSASIDRIQLAGETKTPIGRSLWGSVVRQILETQEGTIAIDVVNKTYQTDTKEMTLTAEVTFLQAARGDFRLQMIQTTNNRNFGQVDYIPNTRVVYPYFHDHVVMSVLPNAQGQPLGDNNVIMPGTKFTHDFTFTSLDSIPSLSDLTFFVYKRESITKTGPVFQSHTELLMDNVVSVQDPMVAGSFALEQNFPNPFNPATTIRYNVPHTAQVKLVVTDLLGREVATLVNDVKTEGTHTSVFDASRLQSGTYFVTMTSGSFIETKTMTLMK